MSDQPMLPAEYTDPITRTRTERAAFLCRTPEEIEELDALAALIHRERTAAPRMAAKYDEACAAVSELHAETVRLRRRVADQDDEIAGLRAQLAATTRPDRAGAALAAD
ncbi:hypothetical protein [Nocardiopsis protaetiae]|uniref:hypothetical protein n=1 Tax=Nocardiopsis protaetiae TaxID=3382270 RepID=UPI00387A8539